MADTAYLKATVGDVLAQGVAETILQSPADSVDYLGRWLIKYVETKRRTAVEEKTAASWVPKDAALAKQTVQSAEVKKASLLQEAKAVAVRDLDLATYLRRADKFTGLFAGFGELLRGAVRAQGCYTAQLENPFTLRYIAATKDDAFLVGMRQAQPEDADDVGEDGQGGRVGVTMDLFEPEEDDEEEIPEDEWEEDEEGNPIPPVRPEPETKVVFVPDVLMGALSDRVHFYRPQRMGCYLAARVQYAATLNNNTLDEAVERWAEMEEEEKEEEEERQRRLEEEDEEEDELSDLEEDEIVERRAAREAREAKKKAKADLLALESEDERKTRLAKEKKDAYEAKEARLLGRVLTQQVRYAVCLDTLGQNRRFEPDQVDLIKHNCREFGKVLQRIDRKFFTEEFARRRALHAFNDAKAVEAEELTAEDVEDEKERITGEYMAEQEEAFAKAHPEIIEAREKKAAEEKKLNSAKGRRRRRKKVVESDDDEPGEKIPEETLQYRYRRFLLLECEAFLRSLSTHLVCRGPLSVLQAALFMLGYTQEQVCEDKDAKRADWTKIRGLLTEDLILKIRQYSPRDEQKRAEYASVDALTALVEEEDEEELRSVNWALAELLGFVNDAIALELAGKQQRQEEKEAAELAKQEAEEEAQRLREEEEEEKRLAAEEEEDELSPAED